MLAIVIVALFTIPISHRFSWQLTSSGDLPADQLMSFPAGVVVSGSWSTNGGGAVNFTLIGATGVVVSTIAASGSFTFTATIGFYLFEVTATTSTTVLISGSYSAPIL
ncbi:MAG: hypothetical protein ACLQC7_03745 [Thermoplasmata archaeon]